MSYCTGNIHHSPRHTQYTLTSIPYTTKNSIEEVIQKLENAAETLFQWFSDNNFQYFTNGLTTLVKIKGAVDVNGRTVNTKNFTMLLIFY